MANALMAASDDDDREKFRRALVGLFPIAADGAAVKDARRRLATYLMV